LPLVDGRLAALLRAAAAGAASDGFVRIREERTVGVVLASRGYPAAAEAGRAIAGVEAASAIPGVQVFHAATTQRDGALVTAGGRVLTVVGRASSYSRAMDLAYQGVAEIQFDGMQYRRDIGRSVREGVPDGD
jgi:phosphoribosylamine--glycine ligase